MTEVLRATVSRAEFHGDGLIRGVASTIGNVDRMRRVFLPGAFGHKAFRVPLLAFHDEKRPLGSSLLTPDGSFLRHESQLAAIPEAETIRELIKAGGIPATSIGWLPGGYFGWRALEKAQPMLAKQSAALGVPQREDVLYFDQAEVVENSVVPIPANPMALIAVASLLPSEDRVMVEDMLEMAAGSRHSRSDAELIQAAHDHMTKLGATCTPTAAFQWTTPQELESEKAEAETEAVDSETLVTETADGKPKYSMPDGSYPISTCADVSDAAKLAHHSKTYSFEQVRRHVMRAMNALNCPEDTLPESWDSPQAAQETEEPGVPTEQAAPTVVELPDLAALEQELAQLT